MQACGFSSSSAPLEAPPPCLPSFSEQTVWPGLKPRLTLSQRRLKSPTGRGSFPPFALCTRRSPPPYPGLRPGW
eukprot:1649641-Prorocentrum_lima.AAC.1